MRRIIASLLILCVLFQSSAKAVIYLNYLINKDFIAKNLCENRNKPCMHCCGKCHLRKQLQQDDENQGAKLPGALKDKFENETFCSKSFSGFGTQPSRKFLFQPFVITLPSAESFSAFRPPCC